MSSALIKYHGIFLIAGLPSAYRVQLCYAVRTIIVFTQVIERDVMNIPCQSVNVS